jgi:hypothetical protein
VDTPDVDRYRTQTEEALRKCLAERPTLDRSRRVGGLLEGLVMVMPGGIDQAKPMLDRLGIPGGDVGDLMHTFRFCSALELTPAGQEWLRDLKGTGIAVICRPPTPS